MDAITLHDHYRERDVLRATSEGNTDVVGEMLA